MDHELFEKIKERKTRYLGYIILRGEGYHFQRLIFQGKLEREKRVIGRRKLCWLRNIRQWTRIQDFQALQKAAINRII